MCIVESRGAYIDYHADGGQGGRKVLRVRRSDVHRNASSVEAAVEGGDQINACERDEADTAGVTGNVCKSKHAQQTGSRTHWEDKAAPRSLQC